MKLQTHPVNGSLTAMSPPLMPAAGEASPTLLEQLLDMAHASALEELVSGIAHELNQPLGAIATYSQAGERMLARPEPMVAQAREVLQQISHAALKAGDGLHRIRRLFQSGPGVREACSLNDVIMELAPVLELLVARGHGRIELALKPDLPKTAIDRRQIQHVLFSLGQNAVQAAIKSPAPPDIRIETESDGYFVTVSIQDNGPGVPTELQGAIFRPFFTTKPGGSGLGLASSKSIVESHEGTIGVNAVDIKLGERGSRFWFRIPTVQA